MSLRLRELIRSVRSCKTAAEERAVIAKECATIRTAFKENDVQYRHRNVAKLLFIHMLGYPTHFGQMECLKLIAATTFPEKRIGYLGLMLMLDERQEVLMLVTNSLKNDLCHKNQYIAGLALCALGNIASAEMARDLAPEVEKLMSNSHAYVRKKAALCTIRIMKKVPELTETFYEAASRLIRDRHHGVLVGAMQLILDICLTNGPSAIAEFRSKVPDLVRIMKSLVLSGFTPDHDIGGLTDPFLQVKTLRLLRILGQGDATASDQMSDILAQVATNVEGNKNAGNAVLYECVQTIMGVESIGGLRVLAINILGRFLSNRDNNIRYVALNMLAKVVAVDTQAVQRHRSTIVDCVKDSDVSIRRRALDLVYALVNASNITTLTKELLEYLMVSDVEFKPDLTNKICALVQRFAPDKRWHIDTLIQVMDQAGGYVKDEQSRALIVLISNAPELQPYTVRRLYSVLTQSHPQRALLIVGVWCLGEYGDMLLLDGLLEDEEPVAATEASVVRLLETLLKEPMEETLIKEMLLTCTVKLSSRFPNSSPQIKAILEQYQGSISLEVQQRACEYSRLFVHEAIRPALLENMPPLNEDLTASGRANISMEGGSVDAPESPVAAATSPIPAAISPSGQVPPTQPASPQLVDLLDMNVVDEPAAPAMNAPAPAVDLLADLLGDGVAPPAPMPAAGTYPPPTSPLSAPSPADWTDISPALHVHSSALD
ncbi:hypothetical protein CYMTET_11164 [Cymbomonas tetramitiformis]|uniref:AP-1 complex subunit gamma n=1 Tax=Cymbomonas tetramitiformis TaxID=36881 RepID=A0AAE0GN52_9CHLO|nr:hypothetical protein CYMTET_11164 [Cymbomonas tetramitiformis]